MGTFIGWPKDLWIRFAVVTAIFLAIPGWAYWKGYNINNALILATGLVLLLYTIETQGMRLQMVRQNEIAIQPLLITTIERRPIVPGAEHEAQVILRNIGRGTALFINVKDIEETTLGDWHFVAKFKTIDYIEAGKDAAVDVGLQIVSEGEADVKALDFVANLNPEWAKKGYDVTISYEDINGQKRESVMLMGKGGIRLLRHGKI